MQSNDITNSPEFIDSFKAILNIDIYHIFNEFKINNDIGKLNNNIFIIGVDVN